MGVKKILSCLFLSLLMGCASDSNEDRRVDPLKNSKKLIKEGHGTLYDNGAFQVPYTKVKLIPPGPAPLEIASSLVGIKARDSFLLALDDALSAGNLVKKGALKSLKVGKVVYRSTKKAGGVIHRETMDDSLFLINNSIKLPATVTKESLKIAKNIRKEMRALAILIKKSSDKYGEDSKNEILFSGTLRADSLMEDSDKFKDKLAAKANKHELDEEKESMAQDERYAENIIAVPREMNKEGNRVDRNFQKVGSGFDSAVSRGGTSVDKKISSGADSYDQEMIESADKTEKDFYSSAAMINKKSQQLASTHLSFAKNSFIKGYITSFENIKNRSKEVGQNSWQRLSDSFKRSNELREKYSDKFGYFFKKSWSDYSDQSKKSLKKAKQEFSDNSTSIGYTLGSLKALSWVTKALFWDLLIRPMEQVGAAVGYLFVNSVAYPTMLITMEGVAVTQIAVQVVWKTTQSSYDLIAPSTISAVASVFSLLEYSGGKIAAGVIALSATPIKYGIQAIGKSTKYVAKTSGKLIKYSAKGVGKGVQAASWVGGKSFSGISQVVVVATKGSMVAGNQLSKASSAISGKVGKYALKSVGSVGSIAMKTSSKVVKGSSWVAGNMVEVLSKSYGATSSAAIKYIGVPLVSAGVPIAGATAGVAVGAAGVVAGSTYMVIGESAAAGTYLFGTIISGATTATGTIASTAVGTAVAAYEVGKAVTVPSVYTMGSGIVLCYGELVHLGAHTILGASDVAYLVLSMEGPRWVIYGVSGKLGSGKDLPGGTILDLQKMKSKGEQFKYIPASKSELKKVVEAVGE